MFHVKQEGEKMAFTNNRLDFYNNRTYDELTHAQALAKGCPNFVNKGLELTGTTLTSGVFVNGGVFGQLGNEGETHEITPNYTGYVIVKSTLNGSSSTSVVELDTTRNDTDPRDAGGVKHFTIYKLNAGVIEEDYRHSNYIKDISFENVGGSMFVQIINGTKSNPFDASTFAGNRTYRLSPLDIGVPDSALPLDVDDALVALLQGLNDTLVDKGGSVAYDLNIDTVLRDLIRDKINMLPSWENIINADLVFNFEMTNLVGEAGSIFQGFGHAFFTDIETNKVYSLPIANDIPQWDLLTNGVYYSDIPEVLLNVPGTAYTNATITLVESIFNFESMICSMGPEDASYQIHEPQDILQTSSIVNLSNCFPNSAGIDHWHAHFLSSNGGITLNPNTGSMYVARYNIAYATNLVFTNPPGDHGVLGIQGVRRIYPTGTSHGLEVLDGITYKVATYNGVELGRVEVQPLGGLLND